MKAWGMKAWEVKQEQGAVFVFDHIILVDICTK